MAIKDRNTGLASVNSTAMPDNQRWRITQLRDRLKDLWDSAVNRSTDAGVLYPVPKTLTGQALSAGTTEVEHNANFQPRQVTFKDSDGWELHLQWRAKTNALDTTIEVYSAEEMENVTINLISWT